jgi:hypothetical protein
MIFRGFRSSCTSLCACRCRIPGFPTAPSLGCPGGGRKRSPPPPSPSPGCRAGCALIRGMISHNQTNITSHASLNGCIYISLLGAAGGCWGLCIHQCRAHAMQYAITRGILTNDAQLEAHVVSQTNTWHLIPSAEMSTASIISGCGSGIQRKPHHDYENWCDTRVLHDAGPCIAYNPCRDMHEIGFCLAAAPMHAYCSGSLTASVRTILTCFHSIVCVAVLYPCTQPKLSYAHRRLLLVRSCWLQVLQASWYQLLQLWTEFDDGSKICI